MPSEDIVYLGERITRTEEKVDAWRVLHEKECELSEKRDKELKEALNKLDTKIDHILSNDKAKLERIGSLETKQKVVETKQKIVWSILAGIGGALVPIALALIL